KYFFHTDEKPCIFIAGDIIFISEKYIVENFEQCVAVRYASTPDSGNSTHEFDISLYAPHCMLFIIVNCKPKEIIHFGVECTKYNAVTSTRNVNMQIIVFYPLNSVRFQKYLGLLGSNIKVGSSYFISGLFKFSQFRKMMIKATDIEYSKILHLNYNISESSLSSVSNTQSIIDIIADDIESITTETLLKHPEFATSSTSSVKHNTTITNADQNYIDLDIQSKEKEKHLDCSINEKATELYE
ncbi:12375_t:CDS:1, partial [Racocetra persica]